LQAILADIHPEDYFGIITFDSDIETWKESLAKATKENVALAIQYVKRISDRHSMSASTSH